MNYLYFNEYQQHPDAMINPALLWEYDLSDFDFGQMRNLVVQRVIERGWPDDWYFVLNYYGEEEVKKAIRTIPYLNDKDMNFVSTVFEIPLSKMKCYTNKQSQTAHWSS
jgi:hypothetical protein